MGSMRLIIFDLDHTLLTVNCSFKFGLFLYQKKVCSLLKLLNCLKDYLCHKWFGMSIHRLHKESFERLFRAQSIELIYHLAEEFVEQNLFRLLNRSVMERLTMAQKQNARVLILSSSPEFLVRAIACRLNVEWKATTYQVDEGGKFFAISKIMEGEEKAKFVIHYTQEIQLPLSATTMYSDSYLDLPVLMLAGQAICVGPDVRLKRVCQQKGWEILS